MKMTYDQEADAKYVYIKETIKKGAIGYTKKIKEWLLADYSANGDLLGIEILNASVHEGKVDISNEKITFIQKNNSVVQMEMHKQAVV